MAAKSQARASRAELRPAEHTSALGRALHAATPPHRCTSPVLPPTCGPAGTPRACPCCASARRPQPCPPPARGWVGGWEEAAHCETGSKGGGVACCHVGGRSQELYEVKLLVQNKQNTPPRPRDCPSRKAPCARCARRRRRGGQSGRSTRPRPPAQQPPAGTGTCSCWPRSCGGVQEMDRVTCEGREQRRRAGSARRRAGRRAAFPCPHARPRPLTPPAPAFLKLNAHTLPPTRAPVAEDDDIRRPRL